MKVSIYRIQLQRIALELEELEVSGQNKAEYIPEPTLVALENLTRDVVRDARSKRRA